MGLDIVQLILDVEQTYNISISDEEASEFVTVGDLYDHILSKIEFSKTPQPCVSSYIFYNLRRGLIQLTGIDRKRITPDTDLSLLLPAKDRRLMYKELGKISELWLPDLCYPRYVHVAAIILAVISSLILIPVYGMSPWMYLAAMILMVALVYLLYLVSSPLRREFPVFRYKFLTLGDLVKVIQLPNYHRVLKSASISPNQTEVWLNLLEIIRDVAPVELENITKKIRLVKDLGLG